VRHQRQLGIACLAVVALAYALACAAAPARADTITVHGTTSAPWLVDPTFFPRIGASGFAVDVNGSLEFSYSYDSTSEFSTGSFTIASFDAGGTLIGTLNLSPTTVVVRQNDNYLGATYDEYTAGAQWTVGGQLFQVLVDLVDRSGTALPSDPADYLNHLGVWNEPMFGIGVADASCDPNLCEGFISDVTSLSAVITPADTDGDGVSDASDKCPGSAAGPVNADGCSIAQLVPCAGPEGDGTWRNHGQYTSSVSKAADEFLNAGLITTAQRDAIVGEAASSPCGK
jgi:hypothetical protein